MASTKKAKRRERQRRSPEELRDLSIHVLWHVRQLCRLTAHLERRRTEVGPALHDPLDAAALEAFLLHARALVEFLWRPAKPPPGKRPPYESDGLAVDYFDDGTWPPFDCPEILTETARRTGWGVLHVSYKRLEPQEAWGWDHGKIALGVFAPLMLFCGGVDPSLVAPGFAAEVEQELKTGLGLADRQAILRLGLLTPPVATAADSGTWRARDDGA
jgi:hypothetical protein